MTDPRSGKKYHNPRSETHGTSVEIAVDQKASRAIGGACLYSPAVEHEIDVRLNLQPVSQSSCENENDLSMDYDIIDDEDIYNGD